MPLNGRQMLHWEQTTLSSSLVLFLTSLAGRLRSTLHCFWNLQNLSAETWGATFRLSLNASVETDDQCRLHWNTSSRYSGLHRFKFCLCVLHKFLMWWLFFESVDIAVLVEVSSSCQRYLVDLRFHQKSHRYRSVCKTKMLSSDKTL